MNRIFGAITFVAKSNIGKLTFKEGKVSYAIELIHETVDSIKGTIHKTYRIIKNK